MFDTRFGNNTNYVYMNGINMTASMAPMWPHPIELNRAKLSSNDCVEPQIDLCFLYVLRCALVHTCKRKIERERGRKVVKN